MHQYIVQYIVLCNFHYTSFYKLYNNLSCIHFGNRNCTPSQ